MRRKRVNPARLRINKLPNRTVPYLSVIQRREGRIRTLMSFGSLTVHRELQAHRYAACYNIARKLIDTHHYDAEMVVAFRSVFGNILGFKTINELEDMWMKK